MRVHLERLVELEYVLVHRGGRGQSFEYELLYDGRGEDGAPFLAGLIDVEALKKSALRRRPGGVKGPPGGGVAGPKRPQNGGVAG